MSLRIGHLAYIYIMLRTLRVVSVLVSDYPDGDPYLVVIRRLIKPVN